MAYKFYGGIHPQGNKKLTAGKGIREVFIPKQVVLPVLQHTGSPSEPVVKAGDDVAVGQLIAKATGFISSPVHSSISGKVKNISYATTPVYGRVLSVYIERNNEDQNFKAAGPKDCTSCPGEELLEIIKDRGIVGLGGAAFPTHVKLSRTENKTIDSLILNGAECEPYLTCDYRLMVEKSREILKGLEIAARILGVKNIYIAIEDNKPLAVRSMTEAASLHSDGASMIKVVTLPTKYPQGAEKQVIKAVLNRVVPEGGLPLDVGCVVQNVATVFAVYEAVYYNKPLIERCITITGPCLKEPVNLWVRVGTLLNELQDAFGGFARTPRKIIIGGPMMGIAQYTMDVPITKRVGGVVFLSDNEIKKTEEGVCIRCGKCLEVCPMKLSPTALMYRVKKERFNEAKQLGIMSCYECAACAYACPAKIPLLDYMKFGKVKV